MAVVRSAAAEHGALQRVQGRERCGGAVSHIVVGGDRAPAGLERQPRLRTVEGLDLMRWTAPTTGIDVPRCGRSTPHQQEPSMAQVSTIGFDLARTVFMIHAK